MLFFWWGLAFMECKILFFFFFIKIINFNTKEAIWPDFKKINKIKIQYDFSNFPDDNNINGRGWNCEIWTHSIEARVRDNLFLSLHINDTLHIQKVKNWKERRKWGKFICQYVKSFPFFYCLCNFWCRKKNK